MAGRARQRASWMLKRQFALTWGWPEPYIYIYIVYDRIFGDFPAKNNVCARKTALQHTVPPLQLEGVQ